VKRGKRTILTPVTTDLAVRGGGRSFWKQILPERTIDYTDDASGKTRKLVFDRRYLDDLALSFRKGAMGDGTPFVLADADNRHTMDPERIRGQVVQLSHWDELPEKVRGSVRALDPNKSDDELRGLYGRIQFPTRQAASAVDLTNGRLGVSARIRENVNGFRAKLIHVLGTADAKIQGMSPWAPALDFSSYASGQLLDLSRNTYSEASVAKGKKKAATAAPATTVEPISELPDLAAILDDPSMIERFDDDVLAEFIETYGSAAADGDDDEGAEDDADDEGAEDDADDDTEDDREPVGAGVGGEAQLSNAATREIQLANSRAARAEENAREALRRTAAAEWAAERLRLERAGIPPAAIDLAAPVLARPNDMTIDLSNTSVGGEEVNLSELVRGLLGHLEGSVDYDVELGHSGSTDGSGGSDPDAELNEQFDAQFGDL
jgi:hypothetical protein